MSFAITEKYGDEPIEQWLADKIKAFAKKAYGLDITVVINKETDSLIPPLFSDRPG